jgi:hypothetical protein
MPGPSEPKAAGPAKAPAGQRPIAEDGIALVMAFRDAYERKDLASLMGLLGADVREGDTVGRAAVQQLYVKNFRVLDGIRYEVTQTAAASSSREGELVIQGRFHIRAVYVDERPRPFDVGGPIRWTIRRDGDALRIVGIDYEARSR